MPSFTKDQIAFLGLYEDDVVDSVLQIINANDLSEKEKDEYIGSVAGGFCQNQYRMWKDSMKPKMPNQQPMNELKVPKKENYPFLAGADDIEVNLITTLLSEANLSEKERDDAICGILDKKAPLYLKWKKEKETDKFLSLLSDEMKKHVQACMSAHDWNGVDMLTKYNPEANRLFNEWLEKNKSVMMAKKDPKAKHLKYTIKIPSNRIQYRTTGKPLFLNTKTQHFQKNFGVALEKKEIDGETIFNIEGIPSNVLDCSIEIFGFLQKTMPYTQYLPPGQSDMVRNKWDKQMRISFMKKTFTDLWVTQEMGYDIVKINAWTMEEMEAAKKLLQEEEVALAEGRKLPSQLPKHQIPPQ